ncbi:MAG: hypothetical protein H6812_06295 [Phycisphaeraceae bacterium]|nr:hypothetical protein [Phycisphaerales bacterium]MCB9842854.1 hypothetical protein [Phycisphaeraceae bacterium]
MLHRIATRTLVPAAVLASAGLAQAATTSTDGVRAIVAEMLADADTRSSFLQSGGNAGHDGKHFFLSDASDSFHLEIDGQIQFRYLATFVDDDPVVNPDDLESGFTTNRTELGFSGHVFDKEFVYRVSGEFMNSGGGFNLEDAYVGHVFDNGLLLVWGQLRMPVLWEDVMNDKYAQAVDMSVVNAVFRQDRSQGIWVHYSADDWRGWFGFSDGIRSEDTDLFGDGSDWALTLRGEFKFAGDWSQFDDFTSPPGSNWGVKLGLATHWQDGPENSAIFPDTTLGAYTADLMLEGDGWNFFVAGVGLHTDPDGGDSFNDWGVVAQGGVYIPDTDWEVFARYDAVIPDSDRVGDDTFNTLTAGVNYYMHGHAAKFTADIQWFFDDTVGNDLVSSVATGAGGSYGNRIGLLPTAEEDEIAIRLQFQLLF